MTKKTKHEAKPMQEDQPIEEVLTHNFSPALPEPSQAMEKDLNFQNMQEPQADGQGDLTPEVEAPQEALTEPAEIDLPVVKSLLDVLLERVEKLEAQIKRLNSHVL